MHASDAGVPPLLDWDTGHSVVPKQYLPRNFRECDSDLTSRRAVTTTSVFIYIRGDTGGGFSCSPIITISAEKWPNRSKGSIFWHRFASGAGFCVPFITAVILTYALPTVHGRPVLLPFVLRPLVPVNGCPDGIVSCNLWECGVGYTNVQRDCSTTPSPYGRRLQAAEAYLSDGFVTSDGYTTLGNYPICGEEACCDRELCAARHGADVFALSYMEHWKKLILMLTTL